MLTIYLCFLAGGAVLPFISFIMGLLSDGIDSDLDTGTDLDTDMDITADAQPDSSMDAAAQGNDISEMDSILSIGFFPTSFLSISAMALIFGTVGALLTINKAGKIISLVLAIIAGYLASVIVQTIINSLKKAQNNNTGIDENELLLYEGKIVETILPGQLGTVSIVTLKEIRVSYPAKCMDENMRLETGRSVKIKEIKNGIFIVEPVNKYE